MDLMNIFAIENNGVNEEKLPPPPRVCPRCNSDNTKFCYYNNYSFSQPRYFCKNCRRFWTHGGTLRNIPIGGSCRKAKQPKVDEHNFVPHMVHVPNQQVNHAPPVLGNHMNQQVNHAPLVHGNHVGSSSSSYVVGNHFGSSSNIHGGMVPNLAIPRTFGPNLHPDFNYGSFGQEYCDIGSGYPMINQSFGGDADKYNEYGINQVDQHNWNQHMDHNAQH